MFELIDREVYEKMPTQEHGKVQLRFGSRLLMFVDEQGIAAHVGVEVPRRSPTDRKNSLIPDVSVQLHPRRKAWV